MRDISIKILQGTCYIFIGKSNLIFSVTDLNGNQLIWLRPAILKFRGSKQCFNVFAIQQTMVSLIKRMGFYGINRVGVVFSGLFKRWIGRGIIRVFAKQNVKIDSFKYRICKPHGIMRSKKKRRL